MSMDRVTFTNKMKLLIAQQTASPATMTDDLQAIVAAMGQDQTTYDTTLQRAPAGLIPGQRTNDVFTNDVLLLINRGKAGNLTVATMRQLITAALPTQPPANTAAPVASGAGTVGSNVTTTNGTWTNSPTFTYQWLRSGNAIAGATAQTYALVGADSGTNCSCRVAGTNAAGTTEATSNAIAVA
jgi:hypothetical protein